MNLARISVHWPGRSGRPRPGPPRFRWKRLALIVAAILVVGGGYAFSHREQYTDRLAELSRSLIGDENTARLESWYFAVQDRFDRTKYTIFGGETNPFDDDVEPSAVLPIVLPTAYPLIPPSTPLPDATSTATPIPTPPPLVLPETRHVSEPPEEGEGVWTTAGLPHSSPDDVLMAKTFLRPDPERPYAAVGVLLVDHRRVRLHITGGTSDPGGDLGVAGPGEIPDSDRSTLLVAWNGGFRGPHGGFGMYADGQQYRPLRDGYASVVLKQDGSVAVGQWGRDVFWSEDIEAVRQNAALLVENCEVSSRTNEGNDTWGYVQVNSAEFITWRSGIGLTENGDLLVAAGGSLSASSLARAMWAAGACWAMQLDINTPYVLTSLFSRQSDGTLTSEKFMPAMADNPGRFLGTNANDFMYLTLDESRFIP